MHSGVLFGLTVLLGHICVCNGINCYSCTFSTNLQDKLNSVAGCDQGAAFNGGNLTTKQCSGTNAQCSKKSGSAGGYRIITRDCTTSCTSINTGGDGFFCCSTDLCNDSRRMEATLVGALASVMAAFLFRG